MTATPTLPPLPNPGIISSYYTVNSWTEKQMQAYALAAYAAGRDAGIEEAAQEVIRFAADYMTARHVRNLKSDAKEQSCK